MHVAHVDDERGRAEVEGRALQPALRLRPLRPQLRAAEPAPLLVQQPARLVPGLRGAGRAARREPGAAASATRSCRCAQGAVAAWPPLDDGPAVRCRSPRRWRGTPASTSTRRSTSSTPAHQRAILHGTGEAWIAAATRAGGNARSKSPSSALASSAFQYKGLFPAIDEASRVSLRLPAQARAPGRRSALLRLPRLAAARRRRGRAGSQGLTLGELCDWPLGETLDVLQEPRS